LLFNGIKARECYEKFFKEPPIESLTLLSTSPACAGRDQERFEMWRAAIKKGLSR
jgi:hypothetical protein